MNDHEKEQFEAALRDGDIDRARDFDKPVTQRSMVRDAYNWGLWSGLVLGIVAGVCATLFLR